MLRLMSVDEIAREYRLAKDKEMQISILADLNMCRKEEIVNILEKQGIEVPKRRGRKKATEEVDEKVVEKKETKEEEKMNIPEEVYKLIEKRMEELDQEIKNKEQEYKKLSEFLLAQP